MKDESRKKYASFSFVVSSDLDGISRTAGRWMIAAVTDLVKLGQDFTSFMAFAFIFLVVTLLKLFTEKL